MGKGTMTNQDFKTRNGLIVNNNILVVNVTSGTVSINSTSTAVTLVIGANDGIQIPIGNTGQRPTANNGVIRFNSDIGGFEFSNSSAYFLFISNNGIAANVLTLTANNTSFVGTVSAANVVSNAQLSGNLASYQTSAGLSANVAKLTANAATSASELATGGGAFTTFTWSGVGGQPSWLWGGNAQGTSQVYNPANFNVNNATFWAGATFSDYLNQGVLTSSAPTFVDVFVPSGGLIGINGSTSIQLTGGAMTMYAPVYNLDNRGGTILYASLSSSSGWVNGSDVKLKENIETYTVLDKLQNLRTVKFNWKEDGREDTSILAHEVQEVFPHLVSEMPKAPNADKAYLGVNEAKLGVLALGGVKELLDRLEILEAEVKELRKQVKN